MGNEPASDRCKMCLYSVPVKTMMGVKTSTGTWVAHQHCHECHDPRENDTIWDPPNAYLLGFVDLTETGTNNKQTLVDE